jgi:hypothetical protein
MMALELERGTLVGITAFYSIVEYLPLRSRLKHGMMSAHRAIMPLRAMQFFHISDNL